MATNNPPLCPLTKTFVELYKTYKGQLNRSTAEPIIEARQTALDLLSEVPLPATYTEGYKRFDISGHLSRMWSLGGAENDAHTSNPDLPSALPHYTGTSRHTLVGDRIHMSTSTADKQGDLPQGIFVGSLADFEQQHPGVLKRYYNQIPSLRRDPLCQLNTLFTREAYLLYLSPDTRLDEPIHLPIFSGIASAPTISFPRILVVAERGSSVRLILSDHPGGATPSLRNSVIEIYADEAATVEYYDIETSDQPTVRIHNVHISQGAKSDVQVYTLTLQNSETRNNFFADLAGQEASLVLNGVCILDGKRCADNYTLIRHSVPNCHSDQFFKYTLADRSLGSFSGRIQVAQDAQKTLSYQNNRNLVLSPSARMYSKPQLEIYADDVKCSHGMTTGQLDENAILYMQQRGISRDEAAQMLTLAFITEAIESIPYAPLQKQLIEQVNECFRAQSSNRSR